MDRLNNERIDVDRKGDALKLNLQVFNSRQFDVLNKMMRKTKAIVELTIENISNTPIEVFNPELVIIDTHRNSSDVGRYISTRLGNRFPIMIRTEQPLCIPYDSDSIYDLLKNKRREILKFQIRDDLGIYYDTVEINGDDFETYIENRNAVSNWQHETVYEFDEKLEQ